MLFAPLWPYNPITPPPLLPHSPIFPPHSRPHFGVLWPSQPSFLPTAPPPPFLCAAGDGGERMGRAAVGGRGEEEAVLWDGDPGRSSVPWGRSSIMDLKGLFEL